VIHIKKIAITGGIATGKSIVAEYLRKKKYRVLCADEIYTELLAKNRRLIEEISNNFGYSIFNDGKLDRIALGKIVFSDKEKLKILNKITHPYIISTIIKELKKLRDEKIVFVSIPLLFESKTEKEFDKIITVYCNKKQQIMRLKDRNGYSIKEAEKRINSQLPLKQKLKKTDFIIYNTSEIKNTHKQIDIIVEKL